MDNNVFFFLFQSLRNLRKMDLSRSENLKEIPYLSEATNLRVFGCNGMQKFGDTSFFSWESQQTEEAEHERMH